MRSFYGNFLTNIRALTYILSLGRDGLKEASMNAVLNANYMMEKLKDLYTVAYPSTCMHEFVVSMEKEKDEYNVSAKDVSKALLDVGIHSLTMYLRLGICFLYSRSNDTKVGNFACYQI